MPSSLDLLAGGVLAAIFVIVALVPRRAAAKRTVAQRTAFDVGLALDAATEPVVIARSERARRLSFLAAGLVAVLVWPVCVHAFAASYSFGAGMVPTALILAGLPLGNAVAAGLDARRVRGDGPRLARSRAVGLADYVDPVERIGARLMTGAALAAAVLCSALPGAHHGQRGVALAALCVLALLAVIALAAFEVLGRRIVSRPQAAGTPTQLAWDDALRAENLRALVQAPLGVGLVSLIATAAFVAGMTFAIVAFGVLGLTGLLLMSRAGIWRPRRHYLRRLWPETAAAGAAPAAADAVAP